MKTKQIFDTVYSIREDGVVITGKGGILKPKLTKNGYHELALYDSGTKKYTWYRLNRLVAMMFIPNPENKPFVNHIDGNKQNNSPSNLAVFPSQSIHQKCHKGGLSYNELQRFSLK